MKHGWLEGLLQKFSIDIAAGDVWYEPHDTVCLHNWFGFAGIPTIVIPVISTEQQFAEKLHSYTRIREHPNSRVKDIVDMVLLIKETNMSQIKLLEITRTTFAKRNDCDFPPVFSDPPENWLERYPKLAQSCVIEESLEEVVILIKKYCKEIGLIQ